MQKVPKEKLAKDLKQANEKVEGPITVDEYRKHGEHSCQLLADRFGTFNKAKEELGLETNPMPYTKVTKEQCLQDLRAVNEEVIGRVTSQDYKERGKHSLITLRNKFGKLNQALEEAGLEKSDKHTPRKKLVISRAIQIEQKLKDERGRMTLEEFRNIPETKLGKNMIPDVIDYINNKDNGLKIIQSSNGGTSTKVFVENDRIGLFDSQKERLPEGTERVFEAAINDGRSFSPDTIVAAIRYIYNEDETQASIAEDEEVTEVTVRKGYHYLQDKGFEEEIKEART